MSPREQRRLRLDRRRERLLAIVIGACRDLRRPLRPVGWLGIAAANVVNLLLIVATMVLVPAPRARRLTGRVQRVFFLVLENRSFDHLLGYSMMSADGSGKYQPATGVDAVTGAPTTVDGPDPDRDHNGPHAVAPGAPSAMADDPPHEFANVRTQLCGPGGAYPHIDMSGFVDSYMAVAPADPSAVMKGLGAEQVPAISTLAREFAVCDRWFSSMPGPTWPNRFFWHAASSGGLDDSPSPERTAAASFVDGYAFQNGTIYELLEAAGRDWAVYHGDLFPQSLAIAGMEAHLAGGHFHDMEHFAQDVSRPDFAPSYVFIEPSYGRMLPHPNFTGGSSQHPIDDIAGGERLIKEVYEAIRSSPHWEHSLLVISYDEHGGFYDHVAPPGAVPPGDTMADPTNNRNGFDFSQLGVRVPAVVVSPFIPRGTVDHVVHDHTSALATAERLFGLPPLTRRDAAANDLAHLVSLTAPRTDTPATLPAPNAVAAIAAVDGGNDETALSPNQAGFLQVALRRHLASAPADQRAAIIAQATAVRTRRDAGEYLQTAVKQVSDTG